MTKQHPLSVIYCCLNPFASMFNHLVLFFIFLKKLVNPILRWPQVKPDVPPHMSQRLAVISIAAMEKANTPHGMCSRPIPLPGYEGRPARPGVASGPPNRENTINPGSGRVGRASARFRLRPSNALRQGPRGYAWWTPRPRPPQPSTYPRGGASRTT